jgi:hypothetical protein
MVERDGADTHVQFYRWALVSRVCTDAAAIAQAYLARGEPIEASRAFELAILQVLQDEAYTKNDLAVVWAILHLGALSVRKICMETGGFVVGTDSTTDHAS